MVFAGRVRDSDGVVHAWIQEQVSFGVGWFVCEHRGSRVRFQSAYVFVGDLVDCMTCLVDCARVTL